MAGESPDRSKQRESSAEPTSGSAGPVPEARAEVRDPRLAVARDTDGAGADSGGGAGGVDTATRVFSVRDVAKARESAAKADADAEAAEPSTADAPGEGGDARLRAAVAAWVRSGDGTPEKASAAGEADVDSRTETDGEASTESDGGAGVEGDSGPEADGEAGADGASRTGTGGGASTEADGGAEAESRTETDGEAGADAESGTKANGEAGAGGASRTGTGGEASTESDGGAGAEGDSGPEADGEAGAGAESRTGTGGGASTEADGGAGADGDSGPEAGAGADGVAEAEVDGEAKADAAAETEAADSAPSAEDVAAEADDGRRASQGPEGASTAAEGPETATEEPETAAEAVEAAKGDAERNTGKPGPVASKESAASKDPAASEEPEDTPQPSDEPRDAEGPAEPADEPRDARDAAEPADAPRDGRADAEPADSPVAAAKAAEPAPAAPKADPRAATGTAAAASTSATGTAGRATAPTDAPQAAGGKSAPHRSPAPDAESRDAAPASDAPQAARGEKSPQGSPAPGTESRAAAPAADASQAARGEKAPQGPPAPGTESRTGGAGGTTAGKTAGKTGGEADAPVDQPTTMLKLPRPTTDRPTTDRPATDRPTSKFVALKPDITTPVPQVGPERTTQVPQVGPERTTQQPLPPKPPLDLLAELTNTPPPPETPLRTTVRRVKIWTPVVLLLAVVFAVVQSVRPLPTPTLQLTAEETYSFDGGKADVPWPAQGQAALEVQGIGSFGSSGEQKPVPIASVAKVMTAYLILRDHPLKGDAKGPMIKVDQAAEDQASAQGESTVKVKAGDEISEREALQGILLASANNVARLVARWDAGSEKGFVAKMNAAAKDLGMTNTTYTDPSGLNDTTVSTAVDQVKLAKKAMQDPVFRSVVSMMEYYDYKGARQRNWNELVGKHGVIGIKTGTTTSARGNLVFAAVKEIGGETRTIFGAVLRQPEGGYDNTILQGALSAGDTLVQAAQQSLKTATILKKGDVVGYVDDGLGGKTPVVATKDVTAVGWSGLTVKLTFAADDVPHTAKAGTKVGSLTVGDASKGAVSVPVALQKDLAEPGFTDKLTRLG
ncbi:D-alanyl-D-alanine carboxypeptidase [Streptomyces sp. TLI_55]|uniref:D-alanyl-D-alanine carboxypeptidase n=1 Tax=Streptomyces sp. TLI_55 TaxID=1938861 RepID=UPI000BCC3F8D|nr:D-alanyl-D-alanine carboxypeptidase [Streptomyces sp. TLI_55]SNX61902.1 D-alanyl-D-alanine carboxypeptidase [Streptomyces sp. TLI_55]